jgi:ABC-2 type transport system permease protein
VTTLAAIARRDFVLRRSYRLAFGADLVFVVVDLLLYYFISEVVGPVPAANLGGAPTYFAFAVSGIVMSLVLMSATADITNRIREEQLTGTLELLCAQPVRTWQLGYGTASFPLAFALVRAAAYLVIAVVALDLPTDATDWPGVAVMLVAASLAFAPIGVLGAAATVLFKRGGTIAGLIVFAMTFVSGALFPLSLLPDWLQPIGRAMPTRYAFDGLRAALFESGGWETDAVALLAIAVVAVPISVWILAQALAHAKRSGTLAQY